MKKILLINSIALFSAFSDHPLTNHHRHHTLITHDMVQPKVQATAGYLNLNTKSTGPNFLKADLKTNDAFGFGEKFDLEGLSSLGNSSLHNITASYVQPLGSSPVQLVFHGNLLKLHPINTQLKPLNMHLQGETGYIGARYSVQSVPSMVAAEFGLELTHGDLRVKTLNRHTKESARNLSLSLSYQGKDDLEGKNQLTFTVRKGIKGLGSTKKSYPTPLRANVNNDYWSGAVFAMREQQLPHNFNASVVFQGQYTNKRLPFLKMATLKSPYFLTFFPDINYRFDSGFEYKVQMGYVIDKDILNLPFERTELYAFYGAAHMRKNKSAGEINKKINLGSTHIGLRSMIYKGFSAFVEGAIPSRKRYNSEKLKKSGMFGLTYSHQFE